MTLVAADMSMNTMTPVAADMSMNTMTPVAADMSMNTSIIRNMNITILAQKLTITRKKQYLFLKIWDVPIVLPGWRQKSSS